MAIKKIRVKNFKSFKDMAVELGNLNILIGANASGKSNFVQIFKFLRDIEYSGLNNAISSQGDIEYLRNINIGSSKSLSLEAVSDQKIMNLVRDKNDNLVEIEIYETVYNITIGAQHSATGFRSVNEKLINKCKFFIKNTKEEEYETGEYIGQGEIVFVNSNERLGVELNTEKDVPLSSHDIFPPGYMEWPPGVSLLESSAKFFFSAPRPSGRLFRDISIYDFDHGILRDAVPIAGKAELDEHGRNLAIILKQIIESEDGKRKLSNLVGYLLPFIEDLAVEKMADKYHLLFKLRETYSEQYLPGFLVSDGTVSMIALIIALYFEKKPLIIVEEPERNIHPHLISGVVNMMNDASENKQIIVTTHNPEFIRHVDKKDILLISRDENGFSSIFRPTEKESVKIFLENGLGIEELYVNDLLGL